MNNIESYFDRIDSLIRHSYVIDDKVTYRRLTPTSGIIDGVLYFYNGSCLEFTEALRIAKGAVYKQRYRYHYRSGDMQIFRYDNAPHHPQLQTFPHHKHDESDQAIESAEVSLKVVLDEIAALASV